MNLKSSSERHLYENFYDKLNKKIDHYNAHHPASKLSRLKKIKHLVNESPSPNFLEIQIPVKLPPQTPKNKEIFPTLEKNQLFLPKPNPIPPRLNIFESGKNLKIPAAPDILNLEKIQKEENKKKFKPFRVLTLPKEIPPEPTLPPPAPDISFLLLLQSPKDIPQAPDISRLVKNPPIPNPLKIQKEEQKKKFKPFRVLNLPKEIPPEPILPPPAPDISFLLLLQSPKDIPQAPDISRLIKNPPIPNPLKIQDEKQKAPVPFKKNPAPNLEQEKPKKLIPEIVFTDEDLIHFLEHSHYDVRKNYQDNLKISGKFAREQLEHQIKYDKENEDKNVIYFKNNELPLIQKCIIKLSFFFKSPYSWENSDLSNITSAFLYNFIYFLSLEKEEKERISNLLKNLWKKPCDEQKAILTGIQEDFLKIFTKKYRLSSAKQLFKELPILLYAFDSQPFLHLILNDNESRNNLKRALAWGINEGTFPSKKMRNLNIAVEKLKTIELTKSTGAFFDRFDYVRENNVSFAKLYNNPYLSDQKFLIGKEIFHVHKAIVRSIPALQKYSIQDENQVTINENIDDVKLNLEIAYDRYYFGHFKDEYKDLLACKRFLTKMFNDPEDSDFLIEASTGEKLYLHKAILECSDLDYFKAIFRGNMKENRESKLVVEQEEFEILKVILEYVYTNEAPEFEDQESEKAFQETFKYYRGL